MTARIISVDPSERKIGLSIRAYKMGIEADNQAQYSQSGDDSSASIGDAVGANLQESLTRASGTFGDAAEELAATVTENAPEADTATEPVDTGASEAADTDASEPAPESDGESADTDPNEPGKEPPSADA